MDDEVIPGHGEVYNMKSLCPGLVEELFMAKRTCTGLSRVSVKDYKKVSLKAVCLQTPCTNSGQHMGHRVKNKELNEILQNYTLDDDVITQTDRCI